MQRAAMQKSGDWAELELKKTDKHPPTHTLFEMAHVLVVYAGLVYHFIIQYFNNNTTLVIASLSCRLSGAEC